MSYFIVIICGLVGFLSIAYFQSKISASKFEKVIESAIAAQRNDVAIDLIKRLEKSKFGRFTLSHISRELIDRVGIY